MLGYLTIRPVTRGKLRELNKSKKTKKNFPKKSALVCHHFKPPTHKKKHTLSNVQFFWFHSAFDLIYLSPFAFFPLAFTSFSRFCLLFFCLKQKKRKRGEREREGEEKRETSGFEIGARSEKDSICEKKNWG